WLQRSIAAEFAIFPRIAGRLVGFCGIFLPQRGPKPPQPAPGPGARIYILLCMFNGFAIARPFCRAIKIKLTGLRFKLEMLRVRWGSRTRGPVVAGSGDDAADG